MEQRFGGVEARLAEMALVQERQREGLARLERQVEIGFGDVNGRLGRLESGRPAPARRQRPAFSAMVFTSSIASVKRRFSSASASAFDFWMRSAISFMFDTARS